MSDPLKYKQYWNQFSGDYSNNREIESYDNMMAEYAAIRGVPIEFFPINVDEYAKHMDPVYGENSQPKWDRKIPITGILEEWSPEVQLFNAGGLQNEDEITLYIHRSTFDKLVGIRSTKAPKKTTDRRGSWGPIAKDLVRTPHNGLVYEVLTGGMHFMTKEAQHFGHKFWYKLTCKVRQVSDASLGMGEQYGAIPDQALPDIYKGNPQYILPTPPKEELVAMGTPDQTGAPANDACSGEYTTVASVDGPALNTSPLILPDGRVADKEQVPGMKPGSKSGDQDEVKTLASEQVIDPQTDQVTDPDSEENDKYGPNGRTIPHKRDLWGDW